MGITTSTQMSYYRVPSALQKATLSGTLTGHLPDNYHLANLSLGASQA